MNAPEEIFTYQQGPRKMRRGGKRTLVTVVRSREV